MTSKDDTHMEIGKAKELLEDLNFGTVAAEIDYNLTAWFVDTVAFRRVKSGDVRLVLGEKGTGKTAIYKELIENYGFIEGMEEDIIIPTADVQGTSDFSQLMRIATGEPEDYRQLWKLYFSLLLGKSLLAGAKVFNIDVSGLSSILQNAGLVPDSAISRVGQWLAESISRIKVGVVYQGVPVSIGIDLQGSSGEEGKTLDVWEVLSEAQSVLNSVNRQAWILVDRLDELFSGMSDELARRNRALQGLMASLLDMGEFTNIKVVIFLRTNIYEKLSFVNKDHLADRKIEIKWSVDDLKLLVARRAASSEKIQEWLKIKKEPVEITVSEAEIILENMLERCSSGTQSVKIEGLLDILRNGREEVTPRDVIYLFSGSRRLQLEDIEKGIFSQENAIINKDALIEAFRLVSRDKVSDFVIGEYPEVQSIVRKLEGQRRARFSKRGLKVLLGLGSDDSIDEILFILYEIGLLRPLGNRFIQKAGGFEIPILYRPALGIDYNEIEEILSSKKERNDG